MDHVSYKAGEVVVGNYLRKSCIGSVATQVSGN